LSYKFTYEDKEYGVIKGSGSALYIVSYKHDGESVFSISNVDISDTVWPPDLTIGIRTFVVNNGFADLSLQEYLEQLGVLDD
jgi:hypothetical protein